MSAGAVVAQGPGGRVVHVASLPGLVGHPEIPDHCRLSRVVLLEDLPVQQALLGEGRAVVIVLVPQGLECPVRVFVLGVGFQVVHHGVAHGVGEGGFLPPEDALGQEAVLLKGVAEQVFPHAVGVPLHLRVQGHDVFHEIQVAEGNPGLQGVDGDAAVRPEHVVHVKLIHPLLCLLLELLAAGGEVRVLVAEELVGNLPGQ